MNNDTISADNTISQQSDLHFHKDVETLTTSNPFAILASPPPSPPPDSEPKELGKGYHAFTSSDRNLHLGSAAHINHVDHPPTRVFTPFCQIDTRAREHMCPYQSAFFSFRRQASQITLSTGVTVDSIGIGNLICKIQDKLMWITNLLCVPSLHHFTYSIPAHRRQRNCSYASTIVGNFITFPNFSIAAGRTTRIPITHCTFLPVDPYDFIYDEILVDFSSDEESVSSYDYRRGFTTTITSKKSDNDDNSTQSLSDLSFSHILGHALHTYEYCKQNTCIVDSGASSHMCPIRETFLIYFATPNSYVTVADNKKIPCLGRGNIVVYLGDKLVQLNNVLHVPGLNSTLFSISEHRRQLPCSFVANTTGSFLSSPDFALQVDDTCEYTLQMRTFYPLLPDPLPRLDFCPTPSSVGSATPAATRSMTIKSAYIDQFYDQVPLPSDEKDNSNDSTSSSSCNTTDNDDYDDDHKDSPSSTSVTTKPTTTTPPGRPSLPVYYKQLSSAPKLTRFTLLGSRSLKNWTDINDIALPTISISTSGILPLELGDVVNLKAARKNKQPVPRPPNFFDIVHVDLAYGDCVSIGGTRYALIIVDRATRYTWMFGLKSLAQEEIIKAFVKLQLTFGSLLRRLYTAFDHRLLSGQTELYLNQRGCNIPGAPASRQHQNGLVERQWQTLMSMARSFLSNRKIPRSYWWWAIRHCSQIINFFPCTVNDNKTTPLELVFGVKSDFSTLLPIFSTTYFRHKNDGSRARDGTEAKVLQAILLGRAEQADGYLLYSPYTKEFYVSGDVKIDSGTCTASAFNLKYDGGLFRGLYDSSHVSNGTEPYPPGTILLYNVENDSPVPGTVTSSPLPDLDKGFPSSSSTSTKYSAKVHTGETVLLSAESMDLLMKARFDKTQNCLPQWLQRMANLQ